MEAVLRTCGVLSDAEDIFAGRVADMLNEVGKELHAHMASSIEAETGGIQPRP
jgi:hypothetical protein